MIAEAALLCLCQKKANACMCISQSGGERAEPTRACAAAWRRVEIELRTHTIVPSRRHRVNARALQANIHPSSLRPLRNTLLFAAELPSLLPHERARYLVYLVVEAHSIYFQCLLKQVYISLQKCTKRHFKESLAHNKFE